nr:polyprenol phosphomannose-dependent alpha 1,6 mannosyltransferase MptB [Kineosporia babensis]
MGGAAATVLALATSGLVLSAPLMTAGSVAAMAVLVLAWLGLGRELPALSTRRLYAITAVWAAPLLVARPLFSHDVWSYIAQGITAARGLDAYRYGPAEALDPGSAVVGQVSHYWLDTPAPYGPAWMLLSRLAGAGAGEHLVAGVALYRLLALAGVLLIAWSLPRLARRCSTAPATALWLGLLNPLVLWHLVAGVHNDALMLGLMLSGLHLSLEALDKLADRAPGRWPELVLGLTLLTVAANIKIVAAVALCFVAIRSLSVLLLSTGVFVSLTLALSTLAGFGWVTAPFAATTSVYSWMSPSTVLGLLLGLFNAELTQPAVTFTNLTGLTVGALLALRLIHRTRLNPVHGVGLVFALVVASSPVVQPWYLLWALLPLAATAASARRVRVVAGFSAVAAMLLPPVVTPGISLVLGYLLAVALIAGALLANYLLDGRSAALEPSTAQGLRT